MKSSTTLKVITAAVALTSVAMAQTQTVVFPSSIDPTILSNQFTNFKNLYGFNFPDEATNIASRNEFGSRATSNGNYNMFRPAGSYSRGTNLYSATSPNTFAATHLGGNYNGLQNVNGTDQYDTHHKIQGSALAGIIVGSVIGALLVIVGLISAFLAWRSHEKRRRSTLYADYRSNYRAHPKSKISDHVPEEYYRESHRQMITPVYTSEAVASSDYRKDNHITYRDSQQRESSIPRPGNVTSHTNTNEFYNQQDHFENPPHLYRR